MSQSKMKPLAFLAVMALTAILVSTVIAVDADAARGAGKGGGKKGGGTPSNAVMTISPNQVPLGTTSMTITGSGFAAGQYLWIDTGDLPMPTVTTLADGSFSLTDSVFYSGGGVWVTVRALANGAVVAQAAYYVCPSTTC
ncbi:MAG TPA: hypothetical protein VGR43_11015 [Dehalococcoidia bacterium]|jgi:hypothetical protein|nr:hypothetical protein [Dehalococcoidia bacterium]